MIPAGARAMLSGDLTLITVSVRRYAVTRDGEALLLVDDLGRVHAKENASDTTIERFLSHYGLTPSDVQEIG